MRCAITPDPTPRKPRLPRVSDPCFCPMFLPYVSLAFGRAAVALPIGVDKHPAYRLPPRAYFPLIRLTSQRSSLWTPGAALIEPCISFVSFVSFHLSFEPRTTTMGNSDTYPSFTCFSDLAGELRNMIWREALPREPAPALVPFMPGCWAPEGDEPDLALRFDHRKLEPIRFDLALLLVNREARNIALAWMSERGFDVPRDARACSSRRR